MLTTSSSRSTSSGLRSFGEPRDDAARPARRVAALVVAAPTALATSVFLHPHDTADAAATLGRIAGADRSRWVLAHLAEPFSWMLLAVVLFLATRVGRHAGRRLIRAGGALGGLGAAAIALMVYAHGEAILFMTEPGMGGAAMEQLYSHYHEAMPLVGPLALAFQLGLVLLGIGLFRSRAVPRWAGVAIASVPVLMMGAGSAAPWVSAIAVGVPLVAGLAGSAKAIATGVVGGDDGSS